jgi:predicted nucleic acid-binding protein
MRHPDCRPDASKLLVCDASVWISLVATNYITELLSAIGYRYAITQVALSELERGRAKGRKTADVILSLIAQGVVHIMHCAESDEDTFLSLVSGDAVSTLDDGEAATLVCAASVGAIAIIDERKAIALSAKKFPTLTVTTTTDLLLAPNVIESLGVRLIADSLYNALIEARMRVPEHRLTDVAALIGEERVLQCRSLPASIRNLGK